MLVAVPIDEGASAAEERSQLVVEAAGGAATFTDQAVAWQLAISQRRMCELDVLADRDRIASDLHDHVIQQQCDPQKSFREPGSGGCGPVVYREDGCSRLCRSGR